MEEIVDIVNEKDIVVNKGTITFCHKNNHLHRGSNIFVFKDKSFRELLLQRRSKHQKSNPLKLCTPGGHLKTGESYLEGAKREFFEEQFNSKENKKIKFEELFKIKKFKDNDYEFITLFRVICEGPFTPDSKEVEESFFKNIDEIFRDIKNNPKNFNQTTILLLKEYKKRYL